MTTTNNLNGSVTAIIAVDQYGDIGLTSENSELTVFGLGSHIHYSSPTNDLDEIRSFLPEITSFIDDLIHCRKAAFAVYSNGTDPNCGGFGKWINDSISINYTPMMNDRIVIRLHSQIEKTILHTQVSISNPG